MREEKREEILRNTKNSIWQNKHNFYGNKLGMESLQGLLFFVLFFASVRWSEREKCGTGEMFVFPPEPAWNQYGNISETA